MRSSPSRWLAAVLATLAMAQVANADVFVLTNGNRIVGELVNASESPRQNYVIRMASGAEVTLERSQIKQVLHPRPEEIEYEKIQPRYPDTVQGQWDLAEWCAAHGLRAQREKHLRRVIDLDPNHVDARHALGYSQFEGKWKTQAEVQTERGYVLYKGRWRLPQEIQVAEEKEKIDVNEKSWMQKVERLISAANNDKTALDSVAAIRDPFAVKGLARALERNPHDNVRIVVAETLAKIGTNQANQALAKAAVEDPVQEVRLTCLDYLKSHQNPAAVDYFVGMLKKTDNDIINRAADALKVAGNPTAIGPLIDSLITTHKRMIQQGNPGQMTTTFSKQGGIGMGMGGGPKIERYQVQNRSVLDALTTLTGVDYGFDVRAWKNWYAAQKRQPDVKTRRD